MNQAEVGKRIRELREESHLTQAQIGKLRGVAQSTVANQENGERSLGEEGLLWYAEYFGVSADYILGIIDEPYYVYKDKEKGEVYFTTQKSSPGQRPEEPSAQTSYSTTVRLGDLPKDRKELEQFVRAFVDEALDKLRQDPK